MPKSNENKWNISLKTIELPLLFMVIFYSVGFWRYFATGKIFYIYNCIDCYLCEKNCPMDIELLKYKNEGKRILSTECILCTTCQDVCPKNAIKITFEFDSDKRREYLKYR